MALVGGRGYWLCVLGDGFQIGVLTGPYGLYSNAVALMSAAGVIIVSSLSA